MDPNYRYLKEKESSEEIKNKDRSKSIKLNEAKVDNKNNINGICGIQSIYNKNIIRIIFIYNCF